MKNIEEILKGIGLDIPADKADGFNATFRENYKTIADYNFQSQQKKELSEQLADARKTLEGFEGVDVGELQSKISALSADLARKDADYAAKIGEMEFDGLLRERLTAEKFTSDYARDGVFADIKAKGLKLENGSILGLDDALKAIKEQKATAFIGEDINPNKLLDIPPAGNGGVSPLPTAGDAVKAINLHRITN